MNIWIVVVKRIFSSFCFSSVRNSTLSLYPTPCIAQTEAEGQQVSLGMSSVEHCSPLHFSRSGGDRKLHRNIWGLLWILVCFSKPVLDRNKNTFRKTLMFSALLSYWQMVWANVLANKFISLSALCALWYLDRGPFSATQRLSWLTCPGVHKC